MVLVWHAIHDEEKREGTLASAQQQFLEAFPEIYRSSSPICPGGAINKLIEKIVSIHPDAEQILVTLKQASAKLPIIVREETHAALIKYAPRTSAEVLKLTYFLEKLKQDGVELIWKDIEKQVSSRILDEFGTIFMSTTLFTNFLKDALWTDLRGLKPLRRELTKAAGHNLSFDYLIRSSSLFFTSEDKKLKQHHVEAKTQQEQIMETSPKL